MSLKNKNLSREAGILLKIREIGHLDWQASAGFLSLAGVRRRPAPQAQIPIWGDSGPAAGGDSWLLLNESHCLVEGLLAEPAPFVRLIPGFGDSSLDFSLIVQLRQFTDQYLVQSELRKRLLARFEQEAI